jgi:hypothetical protein
MHPTAGRSSLYKRKSSELWLGHTLELHVEDYLKKIRDFTSYIYSLMNFVNNQEKFQTNSSVHNINTRNKHHLHRPTANLSCFQKNSFYSGLRIFNSLPRNITNLKNEKTKSKVVLKKYLNAHCFYSVDECMACTDDLKC